MLLFSLGIKGRGLVGVMFGSRERELIKHPVSVGLALTLL
jgi:hypothetical protein